MTPSKPTPATSKRFVVERFSAVFSSFVVERFSTVFLPLVTKDRAKALNYERKSRAKALNYERRTWVLAVVIVTLSLLVGCRPGEDTWSQIESSGVLRVGVDPTFPPFAAAEGAETWGLDVDLARALAAELGLEPQFTYFGYDGLYDALATRQVDVLISALVVAPERTADVAYTDSYFDAGQVLVVPDGSPITGEADLDGRTLAVELGALGHVAAQAWQRSRPTLVVATYGSVDEALVAVAEGAAGAALVDGVGGRLYLRRHADSGLMHLDPPVVPEPYAMAVRIGERTLHRRLNEALDGLARSGRLEEITNEWLGP
jgi:ABC-type amino acid transport substrate-binding protein